MGPEYHSRHLSEQGWWKEESEGGGKRKEKEEKVTAQPTNIHLFVCSQCTYQLTLCLCHCCSLSIKYSISYYTNLEASYLAIIAMQKLQMIKA